MDGVFWMKKRDKVLISVIAGLLAMALYSTPLWWGVLFSPITQQLTAQAAEDAPQAGFSWAVDGVEFRFRSLDLLLEFLHMT